MLTAINDNTSSGSLGGRQTQMGPSRSSDADIPPKPFAMTEWYVYVVVRALKNVKFSADSSVATAEV